MLDQRLLRLLPLSAFITLVVLGFLLYGPDVRHSIHLVDLADLVQLKAPWGWSSSSGNDGSTQLPALNEDEVVDSHPILGLIKKADEEFTATLAKETFDLPSAAQAYRERRGRHPPPGFDEWHAYALSVNAIIVEDFWDQIYHDLTPLWALDIDEMLNDIRGHNRIFKIRNGTVITDSDHFWMPIWGDLIQSVLNATEGGGDAGIGLPDMDIAINTMDEPRLLVPWEDIEGYVKLEQEGRKILDVEEVVTEFSAFTEAEPDFVPSPYPWNYTQPIWPRVAASCPPDSESRLAPLQTDFSNPPNLTHTYTLPHTTSGYVSNYTLSTSLCHQPDLQGLHGFFIEGISASTGHKLFPLFGSSKILQNNEILIPAAMYYKGDERFTVDSTATPWEEKNTNVLWRGLASGGRNKENNWKGFHRHRLVSLLNGTQALAYPDNSGFIDISTLPLDIYNLHTNTNSSIPIYNEDGSDIISTGEWLQTLTDVGFNDLFCFPRLPAPPPDTESSWPSPLTCPYNDYLFSPSSHIPLEEQHKSKYLLDVDGNSFSGRYRDFLRSGSLPIKGSLFREWHDSRLVAWKHFVPVDERFLDVLGVVEFFVGFPDASSPSTDDPSVISEEVGRDGGDETDEVFPNPHATSTSQQEQLPPGSAEARARSNLPRAPNTESLNAHYPHNHDALAQKIAEDGRDWAEKVLRVEDMRVYMYRLLLEYARVMDPERMRLGFIGDLVGGGLGQ